MTEINRTAALAAIKGETWAIQQDKLNSMVSALESGSDIVAASPQRPARGESVTGSIAVLPLVGVIWYRAGILSDIFGGTVLMDWTRRFNQLVESPNVQAIILDVASPGGTVDGVPEASQTIFNARRRKPIIAVANAYAASAAYWLASAAGELVVLPSGEVGSVGVFVKHIDVSEANEKDGIRVTYIESAKFKTEGVGEKPLSNDAREYLQARVDAIHKQFMADVARNRGVTSSRVLTDFGQGRMVRADQAVAVGMADSIGGIDAALQSAGRQSVARTAAARAAALRQTQLAITAGGERKVAAILSRCKREKNLAQAEAELRESKLSGLELELKT